MLTKTFTQLVLAFSLGAFLLSACAAPAALPRTLVISAIPDQDPEKLQRLYNTLATYLSSELGAPVEYKSVTDYTVSITAFKVGDLDLVWYGGLTGVQARLQVEGAQALVQRDIDQNFRSVFIANINSGLQPFESIQGLATLKGHTFTFGSESSTSGRLMPQFFLSQAGLALTDFVGEAGFSGSHDKTIKLVEAGTYDAGVLNEQVWKKRLDAGEVDPSQVQLLWTTPAYFDYHWVVQPNLAQHYGPGFNEKITQAFLKLDPTVPAHKEILDLFGATKFIPTQNSNYDTIEKIARELGKIQ